MFPSRLAHHGGGARWLAAAPRQAPTALPCPPAPRRLARDAPGKRVGPAASGERGAAVRTLASCRSPLASRPTRWPMTRMRTRRMRRAASFGRYATLPACRRAGFRRSRAPCVPAPRGACCAQGSLSRKLRVVGAKPAHLSRRAKESNMDQQQQQQHSQAQHDPKHESQRPGHFDHHRLQAWRVALEALLAGRALCRTLPRGYGKLKDQLERALDGAFTLTSEAAARTGADRACRFRWARAEANEAASRARRPSS